MIKRQTTTINGNEIDFVDVSKMTKAEWESFRSSLGTIGGSDIGTICGVNKWKDPIMLWYEKIGLKENSFEGNDYTTIGDALEEAILKNMFCRGSSLEEIRLNKRKGYNKREAHDPLCTYFPRDMPWAHLNIDGLITYDDELEDFGTGVGEMKKISGRASDSYIGGIPPSYLFQTQFYMWGLRAKFGYVAAFVGENGYLERQMFIDEEIIGIILDKVPRFVEAVKVGKEIWESDLPKRQKYKDIDMVEDTFSDVIRPINWELLGRWLAEPVNIDRRIGSISLGGGAEEWAEKAIEASNQEGAAKLAKQKYHTLIKKHMTSNEANVMENDEFIIKFNKRLSIKRKK